MNGLETISWIDTDYKNPPVGETVLVFGGLAFINSQEVWYTEMEHPPRPIMWRVTHWAKRPDPPQSLINQTEEQRKVRDMLASLRSENNGFISPKEASFTLCDKCLADGTREPSIGLARFPGDVTAHLCANCAEEIVGPL